jgi:hypothetical protein
VKAEHVWGNPLGLFIHGLGCLNLMLCIYADPQGGYIVCSDLQFVKPCIIVTVHWQFGSCISEEDLSSLWVNKDCAVSAPSVVHYLQGTPIPHVCVVSCSFF